MNASICSLEVASAEGDGLHGARLCAGLMVVEWQRCWRHVCLGLPQQAHGPPVSAIAACCRPAEWTFLRQGSASCGIPFKRQQVCADAPHTSCLSRLQGVSVVDKSGNTADPSQADQKPTKVSMYVAAGWGGGVIYTVLPGVLCCTTLPGCLAAVWRLGYRVHGQAV